jgi:hypothetical protein
MNPGCSGRSEPRTKCRDAALARTPLLIFPHVPPGTGAPADVHALLGTIMWMSVRRPLLCSRLEVRLPRDDDPYDDTKQTKRSCENLHHQDLDK